MLPTVQVVEADPATRERQTERALAVLRGNIAPGGVVIKPSACAPHLLQHTGRALVFDSQPEMLAAMADPQLDCDENTVLVLRHAGPVGAPGMPEWGNLPIPKKLLARGFFVGQPAHPQEAAGTRRARHGAPVGRAHPSHEQDQ